MNNLPYTILDTDELYTCSSRIGQILTESFPDDPYVKELNDLMGQGLNGIEMALGRPIKNGITDILHDKNDIREDCYQGLRDYIKSKTHSSDKAIATAAMKLFMVLKQIGLGINNLAFVDQAPKMASLIETLNQPENTQLLKDIGATAQFLELEAAEADFEKTYQDRVKSNTNIKIPLLSDSKAEVIKTIFPLLWYVEGNLLLKTASKYIPVANKIDKVITDIVTIAHNRITRDENEKKNTDKTPK